MDDYVSNKILDSTTVFENIHPNEITIFGGILNLFILDNLNNILQGAKPKYIDLGILLGLRWLADCLDGNVARKYKKTSKIGNILDTISDIMLLAIAFYFICVSMNISMVFYFIFMIMVVVVATWKYNIFESHESIKSHDGIVGNALSFLVANSIIQFGVFFYIVMYFAKK